MWGGLRELRSSGAIRGVTKVCACTRTDVETFEPQQSVVLRRDRKGGVPMEKQPTPPWANELVEGEFISYAATYKVGEYFHLYKKDMFEVPAIGNLRYYFYDPTEHGYPTDKKYPLLVWLHGTSNSLEGDVCINYSGGELYASPEYQKMLGGAYVLIPLANEYRDTDGSVSGTWHTGAYTKPVVDLIKSFVKEREQTIGKKIVFGNSSGATFCFKVVEQDPAFFDGCVPIGTSAIPEDSVLDEFDANDVHLFFAISAHDEFHEFEKEIRPRVERLERMKHAFLYFPKWTKNGDGGIASINFGVEMGQHCLVNSMQANLMFDDGTPMEERLPKGVIGWILQV